MKKRERIFDRCLVFGHLILFALLIMAGGVKAREVNLDQLNPYYQDNSRNPSSYVPNEEIDNLPMQNMVWINRVLVEDSAGVMANMKNSLRRWEQIDEYAKLWNLKSTGLFDTPDMEQRKQFINRNILRYIDKRISGEIKHAKKGSGWAKVGEVQQALKPNTTVKMNKYLTLKIKGRVLEGKVIFTLRNPFVDLESYVKVDGRAKVHAGKEFKSIGMKTDLDYEVNEGRWIASVDQKITDKVGAKVTAIKEGTPVIYSDEAIKIFKLYFHHPF